MDREKIRVLRIINRFNLGGPTYNAAYLSRHLGDDYETMLIGGRHEESEESSLFIPEHLGLKPLVIGEMSRSIHPVRDWRAYRKIRKIIREFNPHIVHTHASKAGLLGRLAAWREHVPVVVHTFHGHVFHSYFGSFQSTFYKVLERWLASKSDGIIAISEQQKKEIGSEHRICHPDKIRVIPLGFDLERFGEDQPMKRSAFRNRFKIDDNTVVISIIGRLVPIKHHAMFLSVVKELLPRCVHHSIRFLVVGDGASRQSLLKKCHEMHIPYSWTTDLAENGVIFTSWIREVDEVLAASDIICLTSLNEGTPVSLIEAQAASRPVVSTRVGGIEDVVLEDESAFLVAVNDHQLMSKRLLRLIEDAHLRTLMGARGHDYVMGSFSYQRLVRDVSGLYEDLLNKKET